jgi:hypothetical protein
MKDDPDMEVDAEQKERDRQKENESRQTNWQKWMEQNKASICITA